MKRVVMLLMALSMTVPLFAQSSSITIEVDASKPGSPIRDLTGVNKKPTFVAESKGPTLNGAALYPQFGVTQVRLHDSGIDVCATYKAGTSVNAGVSPAQTVAGCYLAGGSGGGAHLKWTPNSSADADLNNPNNYDFTTVDQTLSATIATGAAVYLRLGESFNGPNDTGDPVAWAKVATNIYKHIIGVFKPTAGIAVTPAFVEVFNEPDGQFWQGDTAVFDTLFVETVTRVRAAAAAAKKTVVIGGPGFTKDVLQKAKADDNPANGFIAAVGASNLDFFSAHLYSQCAQTTIQTPANWLRSLRALVDKLGGQDKPIHITEWNIGLGEQCTDTQFADQRMQSYTSAVLTFMQDPAQNIQAAHFYSAMPLMALFDFLSVDGAVRINPSAWAFWAHAHLAGGDLLDTSVCPTSRTCVAGYASETASLQALATKTPSSNASATTSTTTPSQQVVVTNDSANSVTYTLRFKGLTSALVTATILTPPSGTRDVPTQGTTTITADSAAVTALLNSVSTDVRSRLQVSGGQVELQLTLPARTVQVVQVRATSL